MMGNAILSRNAAFFAAGGFIAALFLAGVAHAFTDTIFKYSTPKTGYFTLHPMDFSPTDQSAAASSDYDIHWNGGSITAATGVCFNAGLHLPHGAKIIAIAGWFTSSSGGAEIFVGRNNVSTGLGDTLALEVDPDTSGTRKPVNVVPSAFQVVDNQHYMYGLGICMGSTDMFHGARITYTYTTAGD